jgi:hypothetical protein
MTCPLSVKIFAIAVPQLPLPKIPNVILIANVLIKSLTNSLERT